MTTWDSSDLSRLDAAEEIRVATRRRDGTLRSPRIIWVVVDGGRVFIRSANGRAAQWFAAAVRTGAGQLLVDGRALDVTWTEVADDADLDLAGEGYERKYAGRYASIVRSLNGPGPRAATLEVHRA